MVINLEKCVFGPSSVDFLGHRVSAEGVRPHPSNVQAVEEFPQLGTVKQLQAFLGLVKFYRRFLLAIASKLKPLTDALKGDVPGMDVVQWTPQMILAFSAAKGALNKATVLAHPAQGANVALEVDAFNTHMGGCLQQQRRVPDTGNAWVWL